MVDVLTGQRFRYVTLRPRSGAAGHVMPAGRTSPCRWMEEVAALFGGLIAEDLYWNEGCSRAADKADMRRSLVQIAAATDLKLARRAVGCAWQLHRDEPRYRPTTPIAPGWTPLEMTKAAWEHAVWLVAGGAEAVAELAGVLHESSRAVTWTQAREIVDGCEPLAVPASELVQHDMLRPWFLDHCRLNWKTPSPRRRAA